MNTPTPDEVAGMAWWNLLPEHDRRRWMSRAGVPAALRMLGLFLNVILCQEAI